MLWLPILVLHTALSGTLPAAGAELPACPTLPPAPGDPATLFLITAAAGDEPFSYLGHSSLWLRDGDRGIDRVWEFGVIDSSRQEPLSALLLGSLECRWQVQPPSREARSYLRTGRQAVARQLHLSPEELGLVVDALLDIRDHVHQRSLFHWRDNSCATAVRDLLDDGMDGALSQQLSGPWPHSPRDEVLRLLDRVPWAALALDLLAGPSVDRPMTVYEAGFLPDLLERSLAGVSVAGPDGAPLGLLGPPCRLADGPLGWAPARRPDPRPRGWALGLLLGVALLAGGRGGGRPAEIASGALLAALGLLLGLVGSVGLLLWLSSDLEEFRLNRNLLLVSPLCFGLLPLGLAWARGRRLAWGRPYLGLLLSLGLLALLPVGPQANLALLGLLWPPLLAAFVLSVLPPRSLT